MSGALAIAPILAGIVCAVTWRCLRWALRNCGYRHVNTLGCLLVFPLFPFVCFGMFFGVIAVTTYQGLSVTPTVANKSLMFIEVPKQATNVDFRNSLFQGITDAADFTLTESIFMEWMNAQDWEPERFSYEGSMTIVETDANGNETQMTELMGVSVTPVRSLIDSVRESVVVQNGYEYEHVHGPADAVSFVVYDIDTGRVYVQRTTF